MATAKKMTKKEKREVISAKVSKVLQDLLGVDAESITEDKVLRTDFGMDDIYSIQFMMLCEEAFNHEIEDKYFVRNPEIPDADMWQFKTYGKLLDFYVDTINLKTEAEETK